jgi:hypothetical protein
MISPGNSPGILTMGSLSMTAAVTLRVQLYGSIAGAEHSQLAVTGTVTLGGATLQTVGGGLSIGTAFTIIANDAADAVTGTFAGLAQGATITAGTVQYQINYLGDTGNDVVLTVTDSWEADFNGDRRRDLLFSHAKLDAAEIWLMDGPDATAVPLSLLSVGGAPVGVGDFDGDGDLDILLSDRKTGVLTVLFMNGTVAGAPANLATPLDKSLLVIACADFNLDGRADILWRHKKTGQVGLYLLDGSTVLQSPILPPLAPKNLLFGACADFDGDGDVDLLFYDKKLGTVVVWEMNRENFVLSHTSATLALGLVFGGVGDFDGDGAADIVWRNAKLGDNVLWLMDLETVTGTVALPAWIDSTVKIVGCGDYDNDGNVDILWQNSKLLNLTLWTMNGTTRTSVDAVDLIPIKGWKLVYK